MIFRFLLGLFSAILVTAFASVTAQTAIERIEVMDPYVRAVPPGMPNSASFMAIANHSDQAHALVAAESRVAKVVELHTHAMVDGMMRMRRVEKIDLPAGETIELKPGGLHVMMMGLKQGLEPGQTIPVTLVFADGTKMEVQAPVRKLQMKMMKDKAIH